MSEERKYYIPDHEFGGVTEVTKEEHERFMAMWDKARFVLSDGKPVGKPIIMGTGGAIESVNFLFYDSE